MIAADLNAVRAAALELAISRGLVADAGAVSLAAAIDAGMLDREDARLLMTEVQIVLDGRFPEFSDQPTAVAGAVAAGLEGRDGLYPWKDRSRYRPEVYLGEGGMGRVFRVLDTRLNRRVALKFFRRHAQLSAAAFLREAQAQARIDHPNVARVFEAGEHEGIPFLSVQMVQGPTLAQAAVDLSLHDKVEVLRQAALGVHAAHALGIVHRDLKPTNIMLEPDGKGGWRALVVDFGLARDLAEVPSRTTTMMGTPAYMSPEQIDGPSVLVGPHSDVYALGVTLFELLAGRLPYSGSSQAELLRQILENDPPPLRSIDRSLPRDLEAVIQRCLDRDVLRRYDSALELAEDLGRFLEGAPVSVKPLGPAGRLLRRIRRNPVPFASAAAVVLLAGGWGATALASRTRERALGQRMAQQGEALERARVELDSLRADQAVERGRAEELARRVAQAPTEDARQEAIAQLKASRAREQDLAQQVEEARRRTRNDALPAKAAEPPPAPAKENPEPPRPAPAEPVASFIPAQVVRMVTPNYPPRALGSTLNPNRSRMVTVRVQVQLDNLGKVIGTSILEGVDGPWGYNQAALEAASASVYAPAQRGGQSVPGTLDVSVRFLPPRR